MGSDIDSLATRRSYEMSITSAIKKGASAVQSTYNQQRQASEERARRKMANAKTKLGKEKVKLELEQEKVALQQELADAKLALAKSKAALAKTRASARGSSRASAVGKSLSGGFKSFAKWYDRGSAPPKRRKGATKKR